MESTGEKDTQLKAINLHIRPLITAPIIIAKCKAQQNKVG